MTANTRGALFMMASMAAFTFNDACIKATGGAIPLFQLVFLRGLVTSALMIVLARAMGIGIPALSRRDKALIAARLVTEFLIVWLFLTALLHIPIANVTAILQALPLIIALAGFVLFGERLGWRRLTAIGLGFAGVMLIIRPGAAGFDTHAIYALLAALAVAARDLVTRPLSAGVPTTFVAVVSALGVTVAAGLVSLSENWEPVAPREGALIVASAVFILGGYVFSVQTMRQGDIGFTALFRYTGILWALLVGWLFFAEWPDPVTLAGVALVVGTGAFTLWREAALRRRGRRSAV